MMSKDACMQSEAACMNDAPLGAHARPTRAPTCTMEMRSPMSRCAAGRRMRGVPLPRRRARSPPLPSPRSRSA
eukprot:363083-Chlamydomonas_euryale.AAC.5